MDDIPAQSLENSRPVFRAEEVSENLPQQKTDQNLISPLESASHVHIPGNRVIKPNMFKRFFFLVPAALIIGTIAVVAYLTRTDYIIKEERVDKKDNVIQIEEEIVSTPTPVVTSKNTLYKSDIFTFSHSTIFEQKDCEYILCLTKEGEKQAVIFESVKPEDNIIEDDFNRLFFAGDQNILIKLFDSNYLKEFNEIVNSFKVLVDISKNWSIFENTTYNYYIKYPKDWQLINTGGKEDQIGSRSIIRKNEDEENLQSLIIETQVEIENAALTATETVSSTKNLLGWNSPPSVQISNIGGVNAQIISGEFDGFWQMYVVVWHKNTIIQMIWKDDITQNNKQVIEEMLETFQVY